MSERGFPCKTEEVRAILDGRKTQIRRVVGSQTELLNCPAGNNQGWDIGTFDGEPEQEQCEFCYCEPKSVFNAIQNCPYGKLGDRLYVKEAWRSVCNHWHDEGGGEQEECTIIYEVDGFSKSSYPPEDWTAPDNNVKRHSSQMPRWASRITLEIVDVRVERLQDISQEDMNAEGVDSPEHYAWVPYSKFWNSLAKPEESWKSNPWVYVIEFKRVEE